MQIYKYCYISQDTDESENYTLWLTNTNEDEISNYIDYDEDKLKYVIANPFMCEVIEIDKYFGHYILDKIEEDYTICILKVPLLNNISIEKINTMRNEFNAKVKGKVLNKVKATNKVDDINSMYGLDSVV